MAEEAAIPAATESAPAPDAAALVVETLAAPEAGTAPLEPAAAASVAVAADPGSAIESGDAGAVETPAEAPAEPAEPAPADEPKPQAEPPAEPGPAVAYEAFKLPEGIQAEPAQIEAFTSLIGPFKLPQDTAQSLMDLHAGELKKFADGMVQNQQDVWERTKADWRGQIDKQYGNRRDTVVNNAKWAIEQLEPNTERRQAVWDAMKVTGAGDHPAIVGILSAAAQRMRERSAPPPPVPNRGVPTNPADRRYGPEPTR